MDGARNVSPSDTLSATAGTYGNQRLRPGQREFQRAYKACISCRKRKTRCDVSAEDYADGKPCTRCRRELKECVFPIERPAAKQHRISKTRGLQERVPENGNRSREPNVEETDLEGRDTSSLLTDSVVRTVVNSGNDALNLLFEAATQRQHGMEDMPPLHSRDRTSHEMQASLYSSQANSTSPFTAKVLGAPSAILNVWKSCRFVKMGWFSAEEAVWFVERFYQNLAPLSPVLTDLYRDPTNQVRLVTEEPMLCSTILCLSSRYNVLPGLGGASRCFLIHERLWDHCQRLVLRIMLGQERGCRAKTRTLGTAEAFLLLTEWHPRALHFPPPNDGWDSDLLLSAIADDDERPAEQEGATRSVWLEDVMNPAKRSDRMSWMLLGSALSLSHELRVFDEEDAESPSTTCLLREEQRTEQRYRLRKLLYVYTEQLAARLGCKSIASHHLGHHTGPATSPTHGIYRSSEAWQSFMSAWVELTKLVKSVSEMLFPSSRYTKQLLQNGRYVSLIEHFQPLLSAFKDKHLDHSRLGGHFYDMLVIEYYSARIYACSLGLQVVLERIMSEQSLNTDIEGHSASNIDSTDYGFIQEVVDGSLEILRTAIKLSESHGILYAPVRIYVRIIIASMFLIKGMSLGVASAKLRVALDILNKVIAALRSEALDDMHLGSRYATLLELHLDRLQKNFTPSTRPPHIAFSAQSVEYQGNGNVQSGTNIADFSVPSNDLAAGGMDLSSAGAIEDWLTLPLDPSLAFFPDQGNGLSWLGDGCMDFIWNLDT